VAEVA